MFTSCILKLVLVVKHNINELCLRLKYEQTCKILTSYRVSKPNYTEQIPPQLKLHTYFTKSPKRENIYILYLWISEEYNCLILTS